MKKKKSRMLVIGIGLFVTFIVWTILVCFADVQAIGPRQTTVGLATLNGLVRYRIGTNLLLYKITDWLSCIPLGIAAGFAVCGLVQWWQRKKLLLVDRNILLLGGFYAAVLALFLLFEVMAINYRPILIGGETEASYPSSTTVLVLCVIPTAWMQWRTRIRKLAFKCALLSVLICFATGMILGRILSGVHWITDIIGGGLLSTALVIIYAALY